MPAISGLFKRVATGYSVVLARICYRGNCFNCRSMPNGQEMNINLF
jgi:hypothetical protein